MSNHHTPTAVCAFDGLTGELVVLEGPAARPLLDLSAVVQQPDACPDHRPDPQPFIQIPPFCLN